MTTIRHSPLRARRGKEIDLPFAPAPWQLRQCVDTGIIFLANPPLYAELDEEYAYEVTFEKESKARQAAEPVRYAASAWLKRFRSRVLKRNKTLDILVGQVARSPSQRINVLDIGCGWGSLLDTLFRALPEPLRTRCVPHGVEISAQLSRISDEKLRALGGRCIHAPSPEGLAQFTEGYFDVIVMASYLEHEVNPLPVLQQCRDRLKPGGSIIIKVPNFNCINRVARGARWCGFRWPDHVNYFTPATLVAIAHQAGLRVSRMTLLDRNPLSDNMYAVLSTADTHTTTTASIHDDSNSR